jgi:predicted acyl esterase
MFPYERHFGSSSLTAICAGLEAAAEAVGIAPEELSADFRAGKTLNQLAVEKGLNPAAVQQAIQAATTAEPRAAIQQAVADGQLTQDNAAWLVEGLEKDFWGAGQIWAASPQLRVGPSLAVSSWQHPTLLSAQR